MECNGFLNCEEVNISLNGTSNFNEVGASSINIKRGMEIIAKISYARKSISLVDNYDVGNIEYSDNLSVSDNSTVKTV